MHKISDRAIRRMLKQTLNLMDSFPNGCKQMVIPQPTRNNLNLNPKLLHNLYKLRNN